MSEDRANWVGKTVAEGRFHILKKLGEGGMGFVYQAYDQVLETDVVIKVPRRSMLEDPEFKARFARENRALVKLRHPNIVSILFVGEEDGLPYAVMQLLAGGDLKDRQRAAGRGQVVPLPPGDLPTWLPGVAKALDFIHSQGFIHRDVKPANILFDGIGNVYLSDFGVAKVMSEKQTRGGEPLTGTGMVLGTPEYMAPELIMAESFDGRVDQYALAISVYEVLCGRTPFEGTKSESILVKQVTEQVPPLGSVAPHVPAALSDAVMWGVAKRPEERYASCTEFSDAVLAALAGRPATRTFAGTKTGRHEVPPPIPTSPHSGELVEPRILEPGTPRQHETGRLARVETAVHSAPGVVVPPLPERTSSIPVTKLDPRWKNIFLLWLGLGVLFVGFLLAMIGLTYQPAPAATAAPELTIEEKILAIPLAAHQEDRDFTNSVGMRMICLSPGRFVGLLPNGPAEDKWRQLPAPLWVAECEVSVGQYFAFLNHQPGQSPEWMLPDNDKFLDCKTSPYNPLGARISQNGMPIIGITATQMQKFCEWLTEQPGEKLQYRLPTREEWICAYRAGTETPYFWGDTFQAGRCNSAAGGTPSNGPALTHSYSPNPWGLYNMAGNVSELLEDEGQSAGGHWQTMQADHHAATSVLPVTKELWLYGFRVVGELK